jgi:cytochrome b
METQETKVWDLFVRLFHWTVVVAFFIDYVTEDDFLKLHVYAGYLIAALVVIRLLWGFVGTPHARFKDFVYSPGTIITHLKDVMMLTGRRYIGHTPAGGAMILLLLFNLIVLSVTGVAVYGMEEHAGPMASLVAGLDEHWEDVVEEAHEFFAHLTLLLVFLHVAGVILESKLHRESLVKAMITGRKRSD